MYPVGVFHTDRLFFIYSMSYLKYLFFILKEYLFLKRKNELIKNPLLSSLLKCIDMGGTACWDLAGLRAEGWKDEAPPLAQDASISGGRRWDFSPGITW